MIIYIYIYVWLYMYICINTCMYIVYIHALKHVAICWRMDWEHTINNGPSKNGTETRMDRYRWVGVPGHNRSRLCCPPPLVRLPLGHGNLSSTDRTKDTTCGDFPSHGIPSRCFHRNGPWMIWRSDFRKPPNRFLKSGKWRQKRVGSSPKSKSHHLSIEPPIGFQESHERKGDFRPFIISTEHYKSQVLLVNSKTPIFSFTGGNSPFLH